MRSLFVRREGERSPWRSWHILYASPRGCGPGVLVSGGFRDALAIAQRDTALKQSYQDSAESFAAGRSQNPEYRHLICACRG
jgi:hypothetical protein